MKRIISAFLAVFLLTLPALAAAPGQSQVLLRATEDGEAGACRDVSLGSYAADTMRLAVGTDFAFLPTGLLGLNLQAGAVDGDTLALSLPEDEPVYVVSLTPALLKELLEASAAPLCLDETEHLDRGVSQWDGFLQLSGLHVVYNVPSLPGNKVYEAKLDDGSEVDFSDNTTVYTAAVTRSVLDGTYGYPVMEPEAEVGSLRALTARRIADEGIAQEPDDRRIILYGAYENNIINAIPPMLIVFVILLFAFFGGHKWRRKLNFER